MQTVNPWFLAICLFTVIAFVGITVWTRRNERTTRILPPVFLTSVLLIVAGIVISNTSTSNTVNERLHAYLGTARIMASEFQDRNHHNAVTDGSSGNQNKALVAIAQRWIKINPLLTSVKTVRKTPDGKFQSIIEAGNNDPIDTLSSRGPVFSQAWEGAEQVLMPAPSTGVSFAAIPLRRGDAANSKTPVDAVMIVTFADVNWSMVVRRAQATVVIMTAVMVILTLFGGVAVGELIHALALARVARAEMLLQGDQIKEQMELIAEKNQAMAANQDMLAQANARLHALATMDGLTGLMNHRTLMEFLSTHMKRNSVVGSPSSVILFDIDNFKQLNDQYGHLAGDEALRTIGQVLRQSCPTGAAVGRYGGEEFMMVLPGASESAALAVAEEVRKRIQKAETSSRQVTTSIGVSTVYSMSKSEQTLIGEADRALYYSKQNGKNRVTHYGHGLLESAS